MWADPWASACLTALACWMLLSGLDDLFIAVVHVLLRRRPFAWPSESDLAHEPERRIAILVPLWREHRVIGRMLEHNLGQIRYSNYDVFVGVYPNDELTERAVAEAAKRDPRVNLAVCPHDGPTSKGDCLNWIYRRMQAHELRRRVRYDLVITHDAEDLIHRDSLRLINWFARDHEMIQIPVLALPTRAHEVTHGIYCDEFAEYQLKDVPVRQFLGGFLPSNGVGTGFTRTVLERLAGQRGGRIFDPACLTEDYENGYRIHALGGRQVFVPVRFDAAGPVATREFFPRTLLAAIRQRSRWVAGIALQGWEHHGWSGSWRQRYWLWRDRKGLVGNLVSPLANVVALAWAVAGRRSPLPAPLVVAALTLFVISVAQVSMRAACCARIYGWKTAVWVPLRVLWANLVNGIATIVALEQFFAARLRGAGLQWRKTEHVYPAHRAAASGRPKIGEVLVGLGHLSPEELTEALRSAPRGIRFGEYLVRARRLSEDHLYAALSVQAGIPVGRPHPHEVSRPATRAIPLDAARRWRVLPYRIEVGQLHVLTADLPTEQMIGELAGLSELDIRFRLVRPADLEELATQYLGSTV